MAADDLLNLARRTVAIERSQLGRLESGLDHRFVHAVEATAKALQSGRKTIVLGVGKSQAVGEKFAATLNSTAAPSVPLSCQNALHGDLGVVAVGDPVFLLSHSGETPELMALLPHLKKRAGFVVALTGKEKSTLARHADHVLPTFSAEEACPLGLAPTSSSTNMLALCDAFAMTLLHLRGFREADFAELHPGGSLGRHLLTRVQDIMRVGDRFAKVSMQTTVGETILAMLDARSGAAAVVKNDDCLAGIFTHGDFVRLYRNHPNLEQQPVGDVMTMDPIKVRADDLAANVLKIIRRHHIDDLPVINDKGKAVGLIDIQDLSHHALT